MKLINDEDFWKVNLYFLKFSSFLLSKNGILIKLMLNYTINLKKAIAKSTLT